MVGPIEAQLDVHHQPIAHAENEPLANEWCEAEVRGRKAIRARRQGQELISAINAGGHRPGDAGASVGECHVDVGYRQSGRIANRAEQFGLSGLAV